MTRCQRSASMSMESCEYFYKGASEFVYLFLEAHKANCTYYIYSIYKVVYFIISFWLSFFITMFLSFFSSLQCVFFFFAKKPVELFVACRNRKAAGLMNSTVPNTSLYTPHTYAHKPCLAQGSILIRHRKALTYQSQAQLRVTNQELGFATE